MPTHDIVVIGASAGGVAALKELAQQLPADLTASVFVVLHVAHAPQSILPEILEGVCKLEVGPTRDGAEIEQGRVYVAPSDFHLMVTRGRVWLSHGPRENRHRPAIDPLFRSAAIAYGPRVVGVILTGTLDDGAAGLHAIKTCRGTALVQDPRAAAYPAMPENALRRTQVDYCGSLGEIAARIVELAAREVADPDDYEVPENLLIETEFALMKRSFSDMKKLGPPAGFVCPTCHGSLTEVRDSNVLRYRCHTGHAFTAGNLFIEQSRDVEDAMYAAVRAIDENAGLAWRISQMYGDQFPQQKLAHEEKALALEKSASILRRFIVGRNSKSDETI